MTAFPLPEADAPLRSAAHISEAYGGGGADALAAVIKFEQSAVIAGGTEPLPGCVSVWLRRAEEVFQL
jgi:hypothetical protein